MRRLTIREDFGLHEQSREQQKNLERQDRMMAAGQLAVRKMFPQGQASAGVEAQMANAVARLEFCREQDTDEHGDEMPSPMTLSTLDLGVHKSVQHLPQRRGAFDICPADRRDENGNLLHEWDPQEGRWVPIPPERRRQGQ